MITFWLAAGIAASQSEAPPIPVPELITGGAGAWRGTIEPKYRVYPEFDEKPKKRRAPTKPETIVLAPDLEVKTGVVAVRPAWDVMAELQQRADEAEAARRERLRQIALADDEWMMVA